MLEYIQLSLASFHYRRAASLRRNFPGCTPDITVLFLGTVEAEPTKVCWLEKINSSPEKADLCGRQESPILGIAYLMDKPVQN